MRQVEATTTKQVRCALTAATAHAVLGHPWLGSHVPGFAVRRTAMHANGICRPPEAPT